MHNQKKSSTFAQNYTFMREIDLTTTIQEYAYSELPENLRVLVDAAKAQLPEHSYSPYSHYAVGAALRMANGEILCGTNQENAAYPSGLCAERTTLFYASSRYPNEAVEALAIAAYADGHFTAEPGSPCGACRQVMLEYEERHHHPMQVILYGEKRVYVFPSAKSLLPLSFVPDSLLHP